MRRMRGAVWLLAAVLLAPGCATLTGSGPLVEPGVRSVGSDYQVEAPIAYSRFHNRMLRAELWTVNGEALDAVYLYHGLRPGDALLPERRGITLPTLRAGMAAHEVQEFFADTLRRTGAARVETEALVPVTVQGAEGFRFELSFSSKDGLEYQGLVQGILKEDKLFLLYFSAPRLHFYPALAPAAERLFASVELR